MKKLVEASDEDADGLRAGLVCARELPSSSRCGCLRYADVVGCCPSSLPSSVDVVDDGAVSDGLETALCLPSLVGSATRLSGDRRRETSLSSSSCCVVTHLHCCRLLLRWSSDVRPVDVEGLSLPWEPWLPCGSRISGKLGNLSKPTTRRYQPPRLGESCWLLLP